MRSPPCWVDPATATAAEINDITAVSKDRFLGVMLLLNADRARYGRLIEDAENSFLLKQNVYPKSITEAYNMMTNWKQDPRNYAQVAGAMNDGVSFTTVGHREPRKGKNAPDIKTVTCYKCGEKRHYSPECPSNSIDGSAGTGGTGIVQTQASTAASSGTTLLMHAVASGEFDDTHYMFV